MTSPYMFTHHLRSGERDALRHSLMMAVEHFVAERDKCRETSMLKLAETFERQRQRYLRLWEVMEDCDIDLQIPADSPFWSNNAEKSIVRAE